MWYRKIKQHFKTAEDWDDSIDHNEEEEEIEAPLPVFNDQQDFRMVQIMERGEMDGLVKKDGDKYVFEQKSENSNSTRDKRIFTIYQHIYDLSSRQYYYAYGVEILMPGQEPQIKMNAPIESNNPEQSIQSLENSFKSYFKNKQENAEKEINKIGRNPFDVSTEEYVKELSGGVPDIVKAAQELGLGNTDQNGLFTIGRREKNYVNQLVFDPNTQKLKRESYLETKDGQKYEHYISTLSGSMAEDILKKDLAEAAKKLDFKRKEQDYEMSGSLDKIIELDSRHSVALMRMVQNGTAPSFKELWNEGEDALNLINGSDTDAAKKIFGGYYRHITPSDREINENQPKQYNTWIVEGSNGLPEVYKKNW